MRFPVALLLLLTLPACRFLVGGRTPERPVEAVAGRTIRVAEGGAITFPGTVFSARFLSVARDSRCPLDVQCVWAGEALVVMGRSTPTARFAPDTLTTNPRPGLRPADTLAAAPLRLRLTALDPVPRTGGERPRRYTATFAVGRR